MGKARTRARARWAKPGQSREARSEILRTGHCPSKPAAGPTDLRQATAQHCCAKVATALPTARRRAPARAGVRIVSGAESGSGGCVTSVGTARERLTNGPWIAGASRSFNFPAGKSSEHALTRAPADRCDHCGTECSAAAGGRLVNWLVVALHVVLSGARTEKARRRDGARHPDNTNLH